MWCHSFTQKKEQCVQLSFRIHYIHWIWWIWKKEYRCFLKRSIGLFPDMHLGAWSAFYWEGSQTSKGLLWRILRIACSSASLNIWIVLTSSTGPGQLKQNVSLLKATSKLARIISALFFVQFFWSAGFRDAVDACGFYGRSKGGPEAGWTGFLL